MVHADALQRNSRAVEAHSLVRCPFSGVIEFSESFFEGDRGFSISPIAAVAAAVEPGTRAVDDLTDDVRRHDALELTWTPRRPWFPLFDGFVTVRPHYQGAMLTISGTYEPPLRAFGRAFDAIVGRFLAHRTLQRLVDALARHVEREWDRDRVPLSPRKS